MSQMDAHQLLLQGGQHLYSTCVQKTERQEKIRPDLLAYFIEKPGSIPGCLLQKSAHAAPKLVAKVTADQVEAVCACNGSVCMQRQCVHAEAVCACKGSVCMQWQCVHAKAVCACKGSVCMQGQCMHAEAVCACRGSVCMQRQGVHAKATEASNKARRVSITFGNQQQDVCACLHQMTRQRQL